MPLRSMTGYGRSQIREGDIELTIEILSVNRKHLDINVIMSKHLQRFDPFVRKFLAEQLFRGHITVRIIARFHDHAPYQLTPNLALAKSLYEGWKTVAKSLNFKEEELNLSLFMNESELMSVEESENTQDFEKVLHKGLEQALKALMEMKSKEGKELEIDIRTRLAYLTNLIKEIAELSKDASEKYGQKLVDRLKTQFPELNLEDERLLKEIALFADRVDITEEIVRFPSHLKQFEHLLEGDGESAGKKIEFLLQELRREINTIGSKTSEYAVSKRVIEIKTELERIHEQIQNIE